MGNGRGGRETGERGWLRGRRRLTGCDEPVYPWGDDVLGFVLLEHVHPFVIDVARVVDDVYSMADTHSDGVAGSGVCAEAFARFVSLVDARGGLFVREVAVLRGAGFGDLVACQCGLDESTAGEGLTSSPLILNLIWSTPNPIWPLITSLISSGPSANALILATKSPSRRAISFPFARYRGPGISPALIASLTTTSSLSFALAAPKHIVYPLSI